MFLFQFCNINHILSSFGSGNRFIMQESESSFDKYAVVMPTVSEDPVEASQAK